MNDNERRVFVAMLRSLIQWDDIPAVAALTRDATALLDAPQMTLLCPRCSPCVADGCCKTCGGTEFVASYGGRASDVACGHELSEADAQRATVIRDQG